MRPVQERAAKTSAERREKRTELETWERRRERASGECAALRAAIQQQREAVGARLGAHA